MGLGSLALCAWSLGSSQWITRQKGAFAIALTYCDEIPKEHFDEFYDKAYKNMFITQKATSDKVGV